MTLFLGLSAQAAESRLWYNKSVPAENVQPWKNESPKYRHKSHPDKNWEKYALPLGNGSLGAMIYGSVAEERIQFNEKSVWRGGPGHEGYSDGNSTEGAAALKKLQALILSGADKDKKIKI